MKKLLTITAIATLAILFVSCNKENNERQYLTLNSGLLVLNEGGGGMNNASITYYCDSTESVHQDVFFTQNNRKLGDLANDILIYGGKIYISVGGSSTIEITDLNLKSIRQIPLDGNSVNAREPHGLAAHNGKIYVACFDGKLARLDTSTLTIDNIVQVGKNPENIAISNGFAYVTNSGGLDFPNYDSTVSVVNLSTFTEVKKITVGENPFSIGVDENGDIIVGCRWDYSQFSLHRINATTHAVHTFTDVAVSDFAMHKSMVYFYNTAYDGQFNVTGIDFKAYNTTNGNTRDLITNPSAIVSPYAINVNSENEDIYISDAIDYSNAGRAFVFDKNGAKRFDFPTGTSPKKIVVMK